MVDFSNVKNIEIPEGQVKTISKNGTILWQLDSSGLPSSYQQVEYIGSSGTQYINTEINANSEIKIEVEVISPRFDRSNAIIYGGGVNWRNNYIQGELDRDSTFAYKDSYYVIGTPTTTSSGKYVVTQDKNIIYVNNVQMGSFGYAQFNTQYPIYLFAYDRGGSVGEYGSYKIGYCKIYDNDVLVSNLVPCYRKSDNEIGLYDLVNREFLINSGTGTFTKGGDVQ